MYVKPRTMVRSAASWCATARCSPDIENMCSVEMTTIMCSVEMTTVMCSVEMTTIMCSVEMTTIMNAIVKHAPG